ncbi:GAF domain-containing protein [Taibaiella koreensis]|uniref:GAF domain-containing protein n=1 Tax=Taibaiella koreensis TaxID=1268548 RepID=UPI000E59EE7F|nr:GAF domain-containing protein [Taibaiella koreensis]
MSKKPNYDETFCGKLPLHNINLIQPHGCLLVFDRDTLEIIQVSENSKDLLGVTPEEALGQSLQQWIDVPATRITDKFQSGIGDRLPFYLHFTAAGVTRQYLVLIHARLDYLVAECFPADRKENAFVEIYQTLKHSFAEIEHTSTVAEMSAVVTRQLREISDFDRVLLYQFDKDWNGKVIAESKTEGLNGYLGQQFPASDIPKQARAMYRKNTYRMIPDRDYTPVKLYPVINPRTNAFTDLSDCSIRSVAPVHLEYLKNMDVAASMSFRVLWGEQLWGLISLHHRQPRFLDYETCSLFELLSSFISNHLSTILSREHFHFAAGLQEKKAAIQKNAYQHTALAPALLEQDIKVTDLFRASGAALLLQNRIHTTGTVPPGEFIEHVGFWLQSKDFDTVFAAQHFAGIFEEAGEYAAIASGFLALTLNKEEGEFLLLFRPEQASTISWGGNPGDAVRFEADQKTYHPRNSFEVFQEQVRQTSEDWQPEELNIARELRNFLFEFLVKHR